MSQKSGFVLAHGAWAGPNVWDLLSNRLHKAGFETRAPHLPGGGRETFRVPKSYTGLSSDADALSREWSPNAEITQEERTAIVVDAVSALARETRQKVVLVGHSLGGVTISQACEKVPHLIAAVVYITGFMLPPGMTALAMLFDTSMKDSLMKELLVADPRDIGAIRVNFRSEDPDYRALIREAYFNDMGEDAMNSLHLMNCDEPLMASLVPPRVTAGRFGTLPRHYVRCALNRAVPPAGQDKMIAMTDAAMGNATIVHHMEASHLPFNSDPDRLSEILVSIANG